MKKSVLLVSLLVAASLAFAADSVTVAASGVKHEGAKAASAPASAVKKAEKHEAKEADHAASGIKKGGGTRAGAKKATPAASAASK